MYEDVDIFQQGGSADKDLLDIAVEGYEENVPLVAQIAAGFTPPGMAMDIAAAGKYGRDAARDIKEGRLKQAAIAGGIAGLSALGAIPLIGDLFRGPKSLLKGIDTKQADAVIDAKNITKPKDIEGQPVKTEAKRLDEAKKLLEKSASGSSYKGVTVEKRQPIEVLKKPDGTFEQLGGKATLDALESAGTTKIPVKIFDSLQEYNTFDFIRKRNKNVKRQADASKLLPTLGNPTFESPVRKLGNKMEQQFKFSFNAHQGDITSAEQLFDRALRLNPQFQSAIDGVRESLDLGKGFNPVGGKTIGRIDEATGFPVGEVKLMPRTIEKVMTKYDGDFSQITDPIRTRIVVNTPQQEKQAAEAIAKLFPTVDGERVLMKKSGYLDRKLNVQVTGPNGETIIGEIGIVTQPMLDAADKAHGFYETYRKTNFGLPDGTDIKKIKAEGLRLEKAMQEIFEAAGKDIDPEFFKDVVERFFSGGYVSAGKSGRLSPMTPNMFSNSDFDNLEPSTKKSFTWSGVASLQPSSISVTGNMNPALFSGVTSTMTAGDRSQEKYNVSKVSINTSLHKFTKNYNPNTLNIFEEE